MSKFVFYVVFFISCFFAHNSKATIKSGFCKDFNLTDIPVGDFRPNMQLPQREWRLTQHYNNPKPDGFCSVGLSQLPGDSPSCVGQKIYYGHDGIDLHIKGARAGEEDIYSITDGMVIASHPNLTFTGWGESVIIATRSNYSSEEVLTFHYHHLYTDRQSTTSRKFGVCEKVKVGDIIAKEGGTPNWPVHLHLSIKRWSNVDELKSRIKNNPSSLYGYGYSFGNNSTIANFLDPEGLIFNFYQEFIDDPEFYKDWEWSLPYIKEMRSKGWFFGNFDGTFGITQAVSRREGARWVKIVLRYMSDFPVKAHFEDLPLSDKDSPYIEALIRRPLGIPIISPTNSCDKLALKFCPDKTLSRAEALKMVIVAFYYHEFAQIYDNWVWKLPKALVLPLLSVFTDVDAEDWYAPYLYFAWKNGLVSEQNVFRPSEPIKRAEFAKWLVESEKNIYPRSTNSCLNITCGQNQYCDIHSSLCVDLPTCVPQEDQPCPVGGGVETEDGNQSHNDPYPLCQDGQSESSLCPDGVNRTYRQCIGGDWSLWSPDCPIQNNDDSNSNPPNDNSNPQCSIEYLMSVSGASCYENKQKEGQPTLCLETQNLKGGLISWRLCKQNTLFSNNFSYELLNQNHLNQLISGKLVGSSGSSCTPWRNENLTHITQNGPENGAGLIVEVKSPAGCTSPSCTYFSGFNTIYRLCR